jgi:hypothetical protein
MIQIGRMRRIQQRRHDPRIQLLLVFIAATLTACSADGNQQKTGDGTSRSQATGDTTKGCVQTRGQGPDSTIRIDDTTRWNAWKRAVRRGREYRCVVNGSLPAFRVAVLGDSISGPDSIVFTPDAPRARPTQTIALTADFDAPGPHATDALRMLDLDTDGFADLLVGKSWGATGNTVYAVWMFDSRTRRFVVDSSMPNTPFAKMVPGRPCVWSKWNTSAYDDSNAMYCRRDGRWILDSVVDHTNDRKNKVVIERFYSRRGDSMVVVKTAVRPDTT